MSLVNKSGLELLQAMVRGELPMPSIAKTVPMQAHSAEHGHVVFTATANESHLNPLGGVHGGFAATVMDSVTGCAVHTMLDPGVGYGTIDLHVKMVRPVKLGGTLVAEGKVLNITKSVAIAEGVLKDDTGKIFAHASATCMIIYPKSS